jgi:hypothetical protein
MSENSAQYLIKKYHVNQIEKSIATSSHWDKFTKYQKITSKKDSKIEDIKLSGYGFGDFKRRNLPDAIKNLPTYVYLKTKIFPLTNYNYLKIAKKNSKASKQLMSHDSARMVLTLELLNKYLPDLNDKKIVIIGDGYARMGTLIKGVFPKSTIIYVNLGRTLIFDLVFSKKCFPKSSVKILDKNSNPDADFNFIEAEELSKLELNGDLFINIASMQEMNFDQINQYFEIIKNQELGTYFYCCNRESKELPDGSVINFRDYPWESLEIELLEYCRWHQEFPMNRPPFKGKFDGPTLHSISRVVR